MFTTGEWMNYFFVQMMNTIRWLVKTRSEWTRTIVLAKSVQLDVCQRQICTRRRREQHVSVVCAEIRYVGQFDRFPNSLLIWTDPPNMRRGTKSCSFEFNCVNQGYIARGWSGAFVKFRSAPDFCYFFFCFATLATAHIIVSIHSD